MDTAHYRLLIRPSSTCDHHSTFVPITGNLLRCYADCGTGAEAQDVFI